MFVLKAVIDTSVMMKIVPPNPPLSPCKLHIGKCQAWEDSGEYFAGTSAIRMTRRNASFTASSFGKA